MKDALPAGGGPRDLIGVGLLVLAICTFAGACAPRLITLPAPVSPSLVARSGDGDLLACFGRADITPPPGVGLQGYGPDGERSHGHRHRLYARALVLDDADGERIAFVVADLGQVSILLHREVAERVVGPTRIGVDRLMLSATHTHAGPGHFFAAKSYNDLGAAVSGFDPSIVDFLADRMADAIMQATQCLTRAVVAWVEAPLWGWTWNRSYEAHLRNPPADSRPSPPADLDLRQAAVDPTWALLRVDTITARGDTVPAGAFSVFAIHGTGNPPANELYDSDVHAAPERAVERHIDALNGIAPRFEPNAAHLLANGAEGDISPGAPGENQCQPLELRRGRRPGGPKSPPPLDEWRSGARRPGSSCLSAARDEVNRVGDALAAHAVALFDRAGDQLSGAATIARAFRTVSLTGPTAPLNLCENARPGRGMTGGTEDGRTSLHGWKVFGLVPLGAAEGKVDPIAEPCHRPKQNVHWIVRVAVGPLVLPEHMQLMVVRVGDRLLAAVPAELTAEAGYRLRAMMMREVRTRGLRGIRSASVIGLANGYMQYVATPEEYDAQHYEGASTLYGPATLDVIEEQIAKLTAELAAGIPPRVASIEVRPGGARSILPPSGGGRPQAPRLHETRCSADTVIARWLDAAPGTLVPADGPLLEFTRWRVGTPTQTIWDDDRFLEVRALRGWGAQGHLWEARWTPPGGSEGRYALRLLRWPTPVNEWAFRCP